jgi:hypothetical protein
MKIKQTLFGLALVLSTVFVGMAPTAVQADCAGVKTSIIHCDEGEEAGDVTQTGLWSLLIQIINWLTMGIGVVAVGGLAYASYHYISARGDAGEVKRAKEIITDVILGLMAYALMYSLLNYLIPGGIFN